MLGGGRVGLRTLFRFTRPAARFGLGAVVTHPPQVSALHSVAPSEVSAPARGAAVDPKERPVSN
jgi:hypothetical protein